MRLVILRIPTQPTQRRIPKLGMCYRAGRALKCVTSRSFPMHQKKSDEKKRKILKKMLTE
jgi:hypothetical protein